MRIALFHNRYRQRGGEDTAVAAELELLRKAGHEVRLLAVDNREALSGPVGSRLRVALRARWNPATVGRVASFLDGHPTDVAHVHNFFPLLSPSIHHALRRLGVPAVQTLHNYRLLCANGALLRQARPCEECLTRGPWNALRYGCYRGSRLQTAVWADMVAYNRRRGTWLDEVDCFTTPSEFARRMLLRAGLPPGRLRVKPNPVPDPGAASPPGSGAVFVGRLSEEKGVTLLIEAWRALRDVPLSIVGEGPEEGRLRAAAAELGNVRFLGGVSHDAALDAMRRAAFVVVPSLWYEIFPMVVAEAMACGRPVVVAHPTALSEIVEDGRHGLHFRCGDARSLARACRSLAHAPDRIRAMGREARARYEDHLAPQRALERLEGLYAEVIERRGIRRHSGVPRP